MHQVEPNQSIGSGDIGWYVLKTAMMIWTKIRLQITGLQTPNVQSQNSAQVPYTLKTKPATAPYWPPGPAPSSGLHRYSKHLPTMRQKNEC